MRQQMIKRVLLGLIAWPVVSKIFLKGRENKISLLKFNID